MGNSVDLKRCGTCGQEKERSEFHKNRNTLDGLCYRCKPCACAAGRERYRKNPEKRRARAREWKAENKEAVRDYIRQYREENSDKLAEQSREWHRNNRERRRVTHREWRSANKDAENQKRRECYATPEGRAAGARHRHTRRDRERNTENTLTAGEWGLILELQAGRCAICGRLFDDDLRPTRDHIVPVSKGGGLTFGNVQALCQSCNSSKYNKLP